MRLEADVSARSRGAKTAHTRSLACLRASPVKDPASLGQLGASPDRRAVENQARQRCVRPTRATHFSKYEHPNSETLPRELHLAARSGVSTAIHGAAPASARAPLTLPAVRQTGRDVSPDLWCSVTRRAGRWLPEQPRASPSDRDRFRLGCVNTRGFPDREHLPSKKRPSSSRSPPPRLRRRDAALSTLSPSLAARLGARQATRRDRLALSGTRWCFSTSATITEAEHTRGCRSPHQSPGPGSPPPAV